MIITPLQSFGIGDIIFCQHLANTWIEQGHEVLWGCEPQFVEGLNRAYPKVRFVDANTLPIDYNRKDEHDTHGFRVVPLRWAGDILKLPYKDVMRAKYDLFGMDFNDWRKGAMWVRDEGKELELFNTLAGSRWEYRLVNNTYSSDSSRHVSIPKDTNLLTINMGIIPGFSSFDWSLVLEYATEIHTVSTSIIYLLEMLDIKVPIHLYARPDDPKFEHVKYLLTPDKYIFHEKS